MTQSIISQDGTVFNYTNAVACVTCGEYEDEERFNAARNDFSKWLRENIDAVFEFSS